MEQSSIMHVCQVWLSSGLPECDFYMTATVHDCETGLKCIPKELTVTNKTIIV